MRCALLIALAVLIGPTAGFATDEGTPVEPLTTKACLVAGGMMLHFGFTGSQSCTLPTQDGGRACSRSTDCESDCMADTRTCHGYQSLGGGCHAMLEADGSAVTLCID